MHLKGLVKQPSMVGGCWGPQWVEDGHTRAGLGTSISRLRCTHMKPKYLAICFALSLGACAHVAPQEPRSNGQMEVTGVLTDEGVECPALRGRDGQLYTLAGDTGGFDTGDAVTVRGTLAEMSICQQGTTINVQSIERAP